MAGPAFTDVPDRYDVVIQLNNGTTYGFLMSDAIESNLPFRTHKALYSYSPTFLERQNLSSSYGDNFQDFFLTGAQDDFSLGEGQKYFQVDDPVRSKKYWAGQNIDPTTIPGEVVCSYQAQAISIGASAQSGIASIVVPGNFYTADGTNVYKIDSTGTKTTVGAHGLGAAPQPWAMAADGHFIYMANNGISKIVSMTDNGSTFATFSTSSSGSLLVNNNILFSVAGGVLYSIDTAGNITSQFQWKDAKGGTLDFIYKMVNYGGSIFILRPHGSTVAGELWKYDGSGCSIVAQFPTDFVVSDMCVSSGIIFISGVSQIAATGLGSGSYRPTIYYYVNGSIGLLWQSQFLTSDTAAAPALAPFGNGILFSDFAKGSVLRYEIGSGGVHSVFQNVIDNSYMVAGGASNLLYFSPTNTTAYMYPKSTRLFDTGVIQTSQYDFDNTLTKYFRGIKIDADLPAGTSIDIAYELDGVGGSYTSLQSAAASGVEYDFPVTTTAHSISIQCTLNPAVTPATPVLKRIYIRAAPMLQQFRRREYIFDLSGGYRSSKGKVARVCRDGTPYPYDGFTAAGNLTTVATQTIPFTVKDRFGQFTCVADLQQNQAGYDGFAVYEIHPGVYLARLNVREV